MTGGYTTAKQVKVTESIPCAMNAGVSNCRMYYPMEYVLSRVEINMRRNAREFSEHELSCKGNTVKEAHR